MKPKPSYEELIKKVQLLEKEADKRGRIEAQLKVYPTFNADQNIQVTQYPAVYLQHQDINILVIYVSPIANLGRC